MTGIVIGIDVGGPSKGFHAVALRDFRYLSKFVAADAASIAAWCQQIGAQVSRETLMHIVQIGKGNGGQT
jgi:hypothetical protein